MQTEQKRLDNLKTDQSGIAMPLAMIMVMLISVVGAGLLVFVVSDNSSAAQVNRGQQAFGMADAGVGIAEKYIDKYGVDGDQTKTFLVPTEDGTAPVEVTIDQEGDKTTVTSKGTATSNSERRVKAVLESSGAGGGYTAPKNYYAGTNMTLNNYTEMVDGDILVEGQADITNTMKLTDGDVLVRGYGRFPNEKTITNGDFYVGGGASFSNTTTVNNGNIYVDGSPPGNPNTFTNNTTVTNGGIYIGDRATFSNNTKITGGDLYVEGETRVGNLDVSSGGNVLIGGAFNVDNSLKLDNSYLYINGNARIQNATITNSRIFITGTAEFVQTNNITNSVIYAGGNTSFTNSGNLTGTSMFVNGNVNFSNAMTFGTQTDSRYGDWRNSFNNTARGSTRTGIGATGTISGNTTGVSKGTRSYDSTTSPKFVATVSSPQPSNRMRFPFNPANTQGATLFANAAIVLAAAKADAIERIEAGRIQDAYYDDLRQKAISQGNYREVGSGQQELVVTPGQYRPEQKTWPTSSCYGNESTGSCKDKPPTVVYYKFPSYSDSNRVQWLINAGCTDKTRKGILVIENGVFSSYGSGSGFNGTIVLRNGRFEVSGDYCMNGYVNSQSSFTSSNSSRFNLDDVPPLSELNDSSGADRVSWRECYSNEDCPVLP